MAGDLTLRTNSGMEIGRVYGLQCHVAIGSVDDRSIFRGEVNGVLALRDHQIGNVDAAVGFDVLQNSLKFIFPEEGSGDAGKDTEVGILEGVFTGYGSLAGSVGVPRSELALRANFAGRQRVVQSDEVGERLIATDRCELEGADLEAKWWVGVFARDFNYRTVGKYFSNANGGRSFVPPGFIERCAFWWNLEVRAVQDDVGEIIRAKENVDVVGLNG